MRKILGALGGLVLFAGTAAAQEVPVTVYVGDGATGAKVYGTGFLACDVTTNTCKLGNNADSWTARDAIGGAGGGLASVADDASPQLGGNLDVVTFPIVSAGGLDIAITPDTTGAVVLDGVEWPQADGANGQFLQTNGAGVTSWQTPAGSGNVSNTGTPVDSQISVWTSATVVEGTANLTYDGLTFDAGNFSFNVDQTVGVGQDNYVLTYDNGTGEIGLEAAAAGSGTVDTSGTPVANDFARFTDADTIEGRSYAEVRADLSLETGTDIATAAQGALADTSFQIDADLGMLVDPTPSSVTTTWTPVVTGYDEIRATVTASGTLTISNPTTVASGVIEKDLRVLNSSGGVVTVAFSGFTGPTGYLTGTTIANGDFAIFPIRTNDSGATWNLDAGHLDLAALTDTAVVAGDKALCQDISATPDVWVQCDLSEIANTATGLAATVLTSGDIPVARVGAAHIDAITEIATALKTGQDADLVTGTAGTSQHCAQWDANGDLVGAGAACVTATDTLDAALIVQSVATKTTAYELVAADKGKIIVCNNGTSLAIDVDTDTVTWAEGDVVYFLNKGAGACTIQDGTTVDVTISVASDQTAALAQYKSATLFFTSDQAAILTGGMTGS